MAKFAVHVEKQADRISFHVTGAPNANTQLLNECMAELMACAEKNDCFNKGLSVACLSAITDHNKKSQCVSKAFGFAAR
jgi:hypothetical protein